MNNKLFLKACNSVNYQTYNNIKNTLLISSGIAGLSNLGLLLGGITDGYLGYLSSLFYLSYVYLDCSNGQKYTKDVNELRMLYNEFIKKYNIMNKNFSFEEPVSIYTMFNFLLNNGYLSKNKEFKRVDKNCCDFSFFKGVDVFRGYGVCRHVSSLFTDILNDYGINSINVICYLNDYSLNVINVSKENYSREKNISIISKYVISSEERNNIMDKILFLEENGIYLSIDCVTFVNNKKLKYGNHLITYCLYEGNSYYLDPMNCMMYRLKDMEKGIIGDEYNDLFIKMNQLYRMNDLSTKEIKKYVSQMKTYRDSISVLKEREIITSTMDICVNNIDIFEKFYSDNYELYQEIDNKLVKIKKKR